MARRRRSFAFSDESGGAFGAAGRSERGRWIAGAWASSGARAGAVAHALGLPPTRGDGMLRCRLATGQGFAVRLPRPASYVPAHAHA
jgi:hypothetical protein